MKRSPLKRLTPLRRTAMRRKTKRNPVPAMTREAVMTRDGFKCQASAWGWRSDQPCGIRLQVHHRKGRGMGSSSDPSIHDPALLVTLCDVHHQEVESRRADAYECGLAVRRNTK